MVITRATKYVNNFDVSINVYIQHSTRTFIICFNTKHMAAAFAGPLPMLLLAKNTNKTNINHYNTAMLITEKAS